MLYTIVAEDKPESLQTRLSVRQAHLARLAQLKDQGRLVLAGPQPAIDAEDPGDAGFSGSLIVAEFPSLQEAKRWAATDPYMTAGIYQQVSVKPFRKVLP